MPRSNLARPLHESMCLDSPELIWAIIEKYIYINKMDDKKLSLKLHCSYDTVRNRRADPSKLSIKEIVACINELNIPPREIAEVFLGKRIIETE